MLYPYTVITFSWLKPFWVHGIGHIRVTESLQSAIEMDKLANPVLWHCWALSTCLGASLLPSSAQQLCMSLHKPVAYSSWWLQWFQEGCQGSIGLGISLPSSNSWLLFSFKLNKNCSTRIWIKTRGLIFVICTISIGKLICAKHISSFNLKHRGLPLRFQGNWLLGGAAHSKP